MTNKDDDLDAARIAADQQFATDFMAGRVELTYDDNAEVPELPPLGASVSVVRSTRLPRDVDERLVELADGRGVTPGELMRDLLTAAVESASPTPPDPVTALRRNLDAAQRALAEFTSRGFKDAA